MEKLPKRWLISSELSLQSSCNSGCVRFHNVIYVAPFILPSFWQLLQVNSVKSRFDVWPGCFPKCRVAAWPGDQLLWSRQMVPQQAFPGILKEAGTLVEPRERLWRCHHWRPWRCDYRYLIRGESPLLLIHSAAAIYTTSEQAWAT